MLPPDVTNVILDKEKKIRYEVMAYRKLTREEMMDSVARLILTLKKKRKNVQPGQTYVILTIYH